MAKRIINEGVVVVRDGKIVRPEIGKVFDLTDAEIKDIERLRPQAVSEIAAVQEDPRSTSVDTSKQAALKGGKKSGPDDQL